MRYLKKTLILLWIFIAFILPALAGDNLHVAAEKGDLDMVKKMIAMDPQMVNEMNDVGRTPLHLAVLNGHKEVVAVLLESGADVNLKSKKNKRSPLHYAVWKGHAGIAGLLIKKGADVEAEEIDGETPLCYVPVSGSLETMKLLLENKANPKKISNIGSSPLTYSIERGSIEMVKLLVERGADVKQATENGFTLLHRAAWGDSAEKVAFLLEKGIPVDVKTDFNRTPLQNACMSGKPEIVSLLIKAGANVNHAGKEGWAPLIIACDRGHAKAAYLLLEAGANPKFARPRDAKTPLHIVSIRGYGKVAAILLKKGADANAKDGEGITPLYYASRYGHEKIAKLLVSNGAAGEVKGNFGYSKVLKKNLEEGQAIVWYLNHSSWAVKTAKNLLIFDYFEDGSKPDSPLLANGYIDPEEIKDLNVTVFVSHAHGDHYNPLIFGWKEKVKNIQYVLGFKAKEEAEYIFLPPHQKKKINGMGVITIESNDSGVGFVVIADGVKLFHSGDHANRKQDFSGPFKKEIDYLAEKGMSPDLFFAPVSGCGFGDQVAVKKGVYYTIEKLSPKVVFPMHASRNEFRYSEFAGEAEKAGIKADFCCASNSGDLFVFVDGKVKKLMKKTIKTVASECSKKDKKSNATCN